MSLTAIKPYFSSRLEAIGFTEWLDGFNDENIPDNLLDKAFHQTIKQVVSEQTNNTDIDLVATVELKCFFKGFRDPSTAIDESLVKAEDAILSCMKWANYKPTTLKGVYFDSMTLEPYSDDNDNIVVAILVFDVRIHVCIE